MIQHRSHCECGRPASVKHGNAFICERCQRIESTLRIGTDGCYYQRRNGIPKQSRQLNYFRVNLPNHAAGILVTLWFFAFALGSIGVCAWVVIKSIFA